MIMRNGKTGVVLTPCAEEVVGTVMLAEQGKMRSFKLPIEESLRIPRHTNAYVLYIIIGNAFDVWGSSFLDRISAMSPIPEALFFKAMKEKYLTGIPKCIMSLSLNRIFCVIPCRKIQVGVDVTALREGLVAMVESIGEAMSAGEIENDTVVYAFTSIMKPKSSGSEEQSFGITQALEEIVAERAGFSLNIVHMEEPGKEIFATAIPSPAWYNEFSGFLAIGESPLHLLKPGG